MESDAMPDKSDPSTDKAQSCANIDNLTAAEQQELLLLWSKCFDLNKMVQSGGVPPPEQSTTEHIAKSLTFQERERFYMLLWKTQNHHTN